MSQTGCKKSDGCAGVLSEDRETAVFMRMFNNSCVYARKNGNILREHAFVFLYFLTPGGIDVVEIIDKEQVSVIGTSFVELSNLSIHHHVQTAPVCFVKERMLT
ncbi:hypothetical protein [Paenibacillus sp. 1P03SA]|uniref:hypothetical protein n=1 Tax=Paenibacillus sp. 1P03SA TaxID=3132294 RepID=UPI0039A39E83